jgi:hypothetical protein
MFSKDFTKSRAKNKCLNLFLDINFMAFNVLNLNFFPYILLVNNKLEGTIKKIVEKT